MFGKKLCDENFQHKTLLECVGRGWGGHRPLFMIDDSCGATCKNTKTYQHIQSRRWYLLRQKFIKQIFTFVLFFQVISCSSFHKSFQIVGILFHLIKKVVQNVCAVFLPRKKTRMVLDQYHGQCKVICSLQDNGFRTYLFGQIVTLL